MITSKKNFQRMWGLKGGGLLFALFIAFVLLVPSANAAGLLKALNGGDLPVNIKSHKVDVTINNGFSRTEVDQVFKNTADRNLEAVYTFPLPKKASLSELSLWVNGQEWLGEVVEKEKARQIYEEQKSQGNDTALAEKNDFKTFDISIGKIPAGGETRVRIVYYQPLEIDLNVGRFVYPLAEGNVDDERISFWSVDSKVEGDFRFHLVLKSAFPVKDVRVPGFESEAQITKRGDSAGEIYEVTIDKQAGELSKDLVFYYRLDDTVPARVELIPFRDSAKEPGTFMVVVTPAADLKRITEGTDWNFILDVSGSMQGRKIATLADGVTRILGKMNPKDRFRIVTFNDNANDMTGGYINATPEKVQEWVGRVKSIQANGSTNLFGGLSLGYQGLEDDRTTGVILVTDGVANVGPTGHDAFLALLRQHDLRLFTFVIGNSANQPLLDRLAKESGGFAMNISESDDISGRLIQAKAKVLNECLHDVKLIFHGEKVKDLTPAKPGNLYLGEQLVMLGHYDGSGEVEVELKAKVSGQERTWRTKATFPEKDTANPELERLWALSRIDEVMEEVREKGENETLRGKVVDLGTTYSLVTDYTSMIVVKDSELEAKGIQKRNGVRVERERQAQQAREQSPIKNHRVDTNGGGMFKNRPSHSVGSAPVGPLFAPMAVWLAWRKRRQQQIK